VVLAASLLAALSLASGCASRCEAVCERANACTVAQRSTDVDCVHYCGDVEAVNKRAVAAGQQSCDALFQEHLRCWERNPRQICSAEFTDCAESGQAWVDCMTPYCAAVAAAKTTDPNCAGGEPTLLPF
jgi:protein gp37